MIEKHLEKIDFVFEYIKSKKDLDAVFGYVNIRTRVDRTPELGITTQMLNEIIKRLVKDGYIVEQKRPNEQNVYSITFDGLIFEGYVHENASIRKEQERLRTLENHQLELSKRMNFLTSVMAVGTTVAAIYYLIEILKHFCSS